MKAVYVTPMGSHHSGDGFSLPSMALRIKPSMYNQRNPSHNPKIMINYLKKAFIIIFLFLSWWANVTFQNFNNIIF